MRKTFEKILLFSNNFTLLPVVFGLLGAIVFFVIASYDAGKVFVDVYRYFLARASTPRACARASSARSTSAS